MAEADAEKARAEGREAAFRVDAAGQAALNEATNILNGEQTALLVRRAMLDALPTIIAAASKPIENIDKISIVDARGLHGETGAAGGSGAGEGNLADAAVGAAMRYRVGGPLIDALMGELGMDGRSLNGFLAGGSAPTQHPNEHTAIEQRAAAKANGREVAGGDRIDGGTPSRSSANGAGAPEPQQSPA